MKPKSQLLAVITFVALIVLVQACRKFDFFSKDVKTPEFTVGEAKEWYYGIFKGSAEWLNYDRQKNGVKLPDWKHGKYFKVGNTEFVEFPLIKAKTKIRIASKGDLSTGDAVKIVNSSLSRIVFVKTNAKVTIREIDYVPDFNYLKNAGFDISDNYIAEMNKEFTGTLILKTWGGVEISKNYMNNGKLTGKKQKKKTSGNLRTQACEDFLIILYERNCYTVTNGDVVTTECTDWEETDRWIEPVCDSDPECEGMTPAECACMLFGCDGGGGGGGNGGGGDNPPLDDDLIDSVKVTLTDDCFINSVNHMNLNGNSISNQISSILNSCFPTWEKTEFEIMQYCYGDTLIDAKANFFPNSGNVSITLNVCGMQNASKEYIVATVLHEILHAFFEKQGRSSELIQHEQMGAAYANSLRESLLSYFPGLSDNELTSLTWVGLEGTAAWTKFNQDHPNFQTVHNNISTNHRNGTQGTKCK